MEEEKSLIIRENKFEKIKGLLKNLFSQKWFCIVLFFFFIYASTEIINVDSGFYNGIFDINISLEERILNIKKSIYNFFVFPKFLFNFMLYIFSYLILYALTKKTRISCFLIAIISEGFALINYIVYKIRGIALSISDIYSVKTALNVIDGIKVELELILVLGIILFTITNILLFKLPVFADKTNFKFNIKKRLKMIVISVIGFVLIGNIKPVMKSVEVWNLNYAYQTSGAGLTIIKQVKSMVVKEPQEYNVENVKATLAKYSENTNEDTHYPNIIVIMNESFSNLPEVFNIDEIEESTPYFTELMKEENVITGIMHSSGYGGGTANVEYEFLTQNTTAFLPVGAMPFQQYITKEVKQSIVSYLEELNYNSYGIHSWYKSGYSRSKVYKLLKFDEAMFLEDMPNLKYGLNGYSTDKSTYKYWYDIMNNKDKNERNFTFIVTMQNHLPYNETLENGKNFVSGDNSLNSYMQCVNMSDEALKELINFIKNYNEDTILLFFGDHQPNLEQEDKYSVNKKYEVEEATQIVPFFIWANFDIEEKRNIETSTNYLQSLLIETANIPLDEYTNYIKELRETIPVITAKYYIGENGVRYEIYDETSHITKK